MHNALLIAEVRNFIADCLAEDVGFLVEDTDEAGRRALAALARTCRAFSKPALDALWRRLHSLEPLIRCVPTKASYDDTFDEILPPFNEEEWNIVLRYAPRVHELALENDELSAKILQSLWFRTMLLLPNLRKLRWVYEDDTSVTSIRLLLSPSLVHLHVWFEKNNDHTSILRFLECYYIVCPNLGSLHFHVGHFPHMTAAISRAISRSPNLETLGCDDIDEEALIHVAQSRCLRKFNGRLFNHEPDTLRRLADYEAPDRPPFESLRILHLCVKFIIPYFKSQHQPFEEVTIDFDVDPAPEVFHAFFTALCSPTRRRTLRMVDLSSSCLTTGTFIQPVNLQVLSPLMAFNLHINIKTPISLNDNEFVRLVQAWPELETLYPFTTWDYPPSFQLPTLRGLLLLLSRCPRLRALGLCVDARNIPPLSEGESSIHNTAIMIANSPIHEELATYVTNFLLEHFPSLGACPACPSITGQMYYYLSWRKIDQNIKQILDRRN